jgi:hypothetical protein
VDALSMRRARQIHLCLGTLFAPAIVFFAFTGALQTFGLHEAKKSMVSDPPAWIATLAEVHKDQRLRFKDSSQAEASSRTLDQDRTGGKVEVHSETSSPKASSGLPMKIFVLVMSFGLISTTSLGLFMAFKYNRSKPLIWTLLVLGTVIPAALLFIQ